MSEDHGILRAGVIGLGKMGANHARVYSEMDAVDLVGVFDVEPSRARDGARKFGCRAFASLEELYGAGLDLVTVAVPTTLHADVAVHALDQGLHVLVEKPIASTREEALQMIAAAQRADRKLMVGHIERFNPAVQAIKKLVAPADIISINLVRVGPLPPRIKDAGVIIDLAVHDIDLAQYFFESRPESVYCVRSSNVTQLEDTASILLEMRPGAAAQITANWVTPYKSREIKVITPDRLIQGDLITQQVQEFSRYTDAGYLVRDVFVRQHEPLRAELDAFVACIADGLDPAVSGQDGLDVLDVALLAGSQHDIKSIAA